MTSRFIDQLYESVCMQVINVCSFNWNQDIDVDKSIYLNYEQYRETKIREVLHNFAVKKGIMK